MKVYCAHIDKSSNSMGRYFQCKLCGRGWYINDTVPLVVIGTTDAYEASPNYAKQFEPKDLSKKKFVQCGVCKDLVEKRKHVICSIKLWCVTFFRKHKSKIGLK